MLQDLYRVLRPDCFILIAIPLVDSFAWRKYGINWAQLDAPRHLFLHSVKSMTILAEKAGFQVEDIHYDSTSFQFTASELYQRNVPLKNQNPGSENPDEHYFPTEDIEKFEQKAKELNNKRDGDQAQFYLRKKSFDSENSKSK
jgi:predicted SAM-dependent methyltransferase